MSGKLLLALAFPETALEVLGIRGSRWGQKRAGPGQRPWRVGGRRPAGPTRRVRGEAPSEAVGRTPPLTCPPRGAKFRERSPWSRHGLVGLPGVAGSLRASSPLRLTDDQVAHETGLRSGRHADDVAPRGMGPRKEKTRRLLPPGRHSKTERACSVFRSAFWSSSSTPLPACLSSIPSSTPASGCSSVACAGSWSAFAATATMGRRIALITGSRLESTESAKRPAKGTPRVPAAEEWRRYASPLSGSGRTARRKSCLFQPGHKRSPTSRPTCSGARKVSRIHLNRNGVHHP